MLEARNVSFWYRKGCPVIEDVSFELREGSVLSLLGPNGTGKTTLLKCLLGLLKPKKGEFLLFGKGLSRYSVRERASIMAYVPQASELIFPFTVREVAMMGRSSYTSLGGRVSVEDRRIVDESLERLGIIRLAERRFNELSGGQRQMAMLARALSQQAKLLVMDEPTASLDYSNQIKMLKTTIELAKDGYSIVMTTHDPGHAFLACDRAFLLKGGSIVSDGAPNEVVTTESLSELYDTRVLVAVVQVGPLQNDRSRVCMPVMNR